MKDIVKIFTDGSCDNRIADCSASAAVIIYKGEVIKEVVEGSFSSSTNNRAELRAIIIGLEAVKSGFKIELTSDSEYCLGYCKQFNKGEYTEAESKVVDKHSGNLKFHWCRGHAGNYWNELCDKLCGEAALRPNPTRDIGSGIGECPKMGWFHHDSGTAFLDFVDTQSFDRNEANACEYLGSARKMSKKEVTAILRERGWKLKDINELIIDTSSYVKPV